jgi:hypothetical protein
VVPLGRVLTSTWYPHHVGKQSEAGEQQQEQDQTEEEEILEEGEEEGLLEVDLGVDGGWAKTSTVGTLGNKQSGVVDWREVVAAAAAGELGGEYTRSNSTGYTTGKQSQSARVRLTDPEVGLYKLNSVNP